MNITNTLFMKTQFRLIQFLNRRNIAFVFLLSVWCLLLSSTSTGDHAKDSENSLAPTVTCQDITVSLDDTGTITILPEDVIDPNGNNSGIVTSFLDVSSFGCSNLGPNGVLLTVEDAEGNTATCNATVTVLDDTAPEISATNETSVLQLLASDGVSNDFLGSAVALSGNRAIVGAPNKEEIAFRSGAAYIFEFNGNTWGETQKLVPSGGGDSYRFGKAVGIDGNFAVVGVPGNDDFGFSSGAAYIFEYDGTSWQEVAKLTASDGALGDTFGESVSISGTRVAIGAYRSDTNGTDAGAAYVFEYNGTNWVETAKLLASDGASFDRFGESISASGNRIAIGAPSNDDNGDASGSVYVFEYDGTNWQEEANLTPPAVTPFDVFGEGLSLDGDRLIAGAISDNEAGSNAGAAYILEYDGTDWQVMNKLIASDAASADLFGLSVSIAGDRAIVGSPQDDDLGPLSGSAYIFEYDGTNWQETQKLLPTVDGGSLFGFSVATNGVVDFVGARYDDTNANRAGAAYAFFDVINCDGLDTEVIADPVQCTASISITDPSYADNCNITSAQYDFDGDGTIDFTGNNPTHNYPLGTSFSKFIATDASGNAAACIFEVTVTEEQAPIIGDISQLQKVLASDGSSDDRLGVSVDVSGQFAIAGAPFADGIVSETGAAYIFEYDGTNWVEKAKLIASDGAYYDEFGRNVAISGNRAIVSAYNHDAGAPGSGAAYIFEYDGTNWIETAKLTASIPTAGEVFGFDVDISGSQAIVGSISGTAYLFANSGSGWFLNAAPFTNTGVADDNFGTRVAISNGRIVIAANRDDENGSNAGAAYVIEFADYAWQIVAKLTASDGAANDRFGEEVAISGSRIIVGASQNDDDGLSSGSAYIFEYDGTNWVEATKLTASDAESGDLFGQRVAIDGVQAIVGAPNKDDNGSQSGAAYVFSFNGTSWQEDRKWIAPDGEAFDQFGFGVSISGANQIIGAFDDDDNGELAGAVYFPESNCGVVAVSTPTDPGQCNALVSLTDPIYTDNCGTATVRYDFDNDGVVDFIGNDPNQMYSLGSTISRVLVEDASGNFASCVFEVTVVDEEAPTATCQNATVVLNEVGFGTLTIEDINIGFADNCGAVTPVGISTNTFDCSHVGTPVSVTFSAVDEAGNVGTCTSTVTVLDNEFPVVGGTNGTAIVKLLLSDAAEDDLLGANVAVSGNRAIFGVPEKNDGGFPVGAAYIFEFDGNTWVETQKLTASDAADFDRFGSAVDIDGNYAIVGSFNDDDGGGASGSAYIFEYNGTSWQEMNKLTASDAAPGDLFGEAVSIAGTRVVIGAPGDDDNGSNSGSAYVFDYDGTNWLETEKLTASDGALFDDFGAKLSISSNRIVISAVGDDDNGSGSGSVYVFDFDGTNWQETAKLTNSDGGNFDSFGRDVSLSNDRLLIGANGDDDGGKWCRSGLYF